MSIAGTVKWYLDSHAFSYEVLQHRRTSSSAETAEAAEVAAAGEAS